MNSPCGRGLFLSLSLIVAIGPQNIFLLRTGAGRRYRFLAAGISACGDCLLIILGAFGFGPFCEQITLSSLECDGLARLTLRILQRSR